MVFMILQVFPLGPLETNAILIGCSQTKQAAVIDPAQGASKYILKESDRQGLLIDKILLTHSHWDHIVDVQELKAKTGAKVYVHPLDAGNVEIPGSDKLPLFFPIQGVKPDHFFHDGELFQVGNLEIQVIHTPGHSPGCVCFYLPKEKTLISGDTLFRGSIGNLTLPTACAAQMWPSLRKLAALPADTRVIPGHGGETTIGQEKWLSKASDIFKE